MNKEICVLGSGMVSIFRSDFGRDPLSYFKDDDRIFIARDIEDARKREQNGEKVALIINGALGVLWCCPVINGELKQGMFSGAFVYTSNDVVMTGYSHPIRLMDRFEHPLSFDVVELCPCCGEEVELKGASYQKPQKCPNCGKYIMPCSLCNHDAPCRCLADKLNRNTGKFEE